MGIEKRTVVAVRPAAALRARPRLAAALEEAFPVRLRPWRAGGRGADAVIEFAEGPHAVDDSAAALPAFVVAGETAPGATPEPVRIASEAPVDRRVRGTLLHDRLVATMPAGGEDGVVLGSAASGPAWLLTRSAADRHVVRSALPELGSGEVLYHLLSRRAIAMVALMHFLSSLTETGAAPPPLRACFVFDDPNLRRRSYGFIDYRRLVAHADEHGYHASMAMIPLDAGRPHPAAAELFARRPDRVSLVVHGNDHIDNELLAAADDRAAMAIAAQAVRRIARFERRTRLRVQRVMMPPHGLCSRAMAGALGAVGFDALCALHPNPWTAELPSEPLLAGWRPAEWVRGCPVIPRVPLISSDADLALRALLGHPLIVYGHHEDVAGGLEPLAEMADRINRLGDVRWTSVEEIALANHRLAVDGGRGIVAPFGRRARVSVPDGVRAITVAAPGTDPDALAGWSLGRAPATLHPFGADAPVTGGSAIDIAMHSARPVDPSAVAPPAWRPWPRVRRTATEARDRWRPVIARAGAQ